MDQLDTTGMQAKRRNLNINFPPEFAGPILAAAKARDLSLTAFTRRCLMSVVTYDLGLDWFDVMADEPGLRGFSNTIDPVVGFGEGHGPWKIMNLATHER